MVLILGVENRNLVILPTHTKKKKYVYKFATLPVAEMIMIQ